MIDDRQLDCRAFGATFGSCVVCTGSTPSQTHAGVALADARNINGKLTVDAIVMATAAAMDAVVITGDPADFASLARHFPGVGVLAA